MIPFTVYEVLLHTVGLRHYWPYQLLLVLLDIGCGWLLFLLLRRKVHPLVAGAASAVLMLLGPAWQDLLWPFQFGFLGSVAGGLGALVLLDRDTRRGDIGACICLVASVACSGVGLPFVVGVIVELAWRRQSWRRIWIPAIPLGLFVVWYEAIGKSATSSSISPGSVGALHRLRHSNHRRRTRRTRIDRRVRADGCARRGDHRRSRAKSGPGGATRHGHERAPGVLAADPAGPRRLPGQRQPLPLPSGRPRLGRGRRASDIDLEEATGASCRQACRHGRPAWAAIAALFVVAFAALAIWWNAAHAHRAARQVSSGVSAQVETELGAVTLAGPPSRRPSGRTGL